MMTLRQNAGIDALSVLRSDRVPNDRYLYLSGRIRALEIQLMDHARTIRLFEARSVEDVTRLMADCGYPAADDPDTSLELETIAAFDLVRSLMPQPDFVDILKLFHDIHNLKVIMKNLTPAWPKRSADELSDEDSLPETAPAYGLASVKDYESFFLQPSIVDPQTLYLAIRDRKPGEVPPWIYEAAVEAAKAYQLTYDIGMIDSILDKTAYQVALAQAQLLDNSFFTGYLQLMVDLANLGMLLRCRFLKRSKNFFKKIAIPGGSRAMDFFVDLYDAPVEKIQEQFSGTNFSALADLAPTYGQPGTAATYSRVADNLVTRYLSQAKLIWCGPEVPMAYLISRLMEIKNIRIVLTGLFNQMPSSQYRELEREPYMTWR